MTELSGEFYASINKYYLASNTHYNVLSVSSYGKICLVYIITL